MKEYTYKVRIYPNKEQELFFAKSFGCVRYVYNRALNQALESYKTSGKKLSIYDLQQLLPVWKKELPWLKEPIAQSLHSEIYYNLGASFNRFFKGLSKFPKFKIKASRQSFHIPQRCKIRDNKLFIPKLKPGFKIKGFDRIKGNIRRVTIVKHSDRRYYACILVKKEIEPKPLLDRTVGIDLGIKTLITCSNGQAFENPKILYNYQKTLRTRQKALSRTQKGSKGRDKARVKLAKIHQKISDIRNDYLHKLTSKLINESQVICVEDLNVNKMLKNGKLAKSISDVSWSELVRQLTYKANWYGRELIKIDKYFPSSKLCSCCGSLKEDLSLVDRSWSCSSCGVQHDRDLNASFNILKEGLKIRTAGYAGLACCPDVRPEAIQAVGWAGSSYFNN